MRSPGKVLSVHPNLFLGRIRDGDPLDRFLVGWQAGTEGGVLGQPGVEVVSRVDPFGVAVGGYDVLVVPRVDRPRTIEAAEPISVCEDPDTHDEFGITVLLDGIDTLAMR